MWESYLIRQKRGSLVGTKGATAFCFLSLTVYGILSGISRVSDSPWLQTCIMLKQRNNSGSPDPSTTSQGWGLESFHRPARSCPQRTFPLILHNSWKWLVLSVTWSWTHQITTIMRDLKVPKGAGFDFFLLDAMERNKWELGHRFVWINWVHMENLKLFLWGLVYMERIHAVRPVIKGSEFASGVFVFF